MFYDFMAIVRCISNLRFCILALRLYVLAGRLCRRPARMDFVMQTDCLFCLGFRVLCPVFCRMGKIICIFGGLIVKDYLYET